MAYYHFGRLAESGASAYTEPVGLACFAYQASIAAGMPRSLAEQVWQERVTKEFLMRLLRIAAVGAAVLASAQANAQ